MKKNGQHWSSSIGVRNMSKSSTLHLPEQNSCHQDAHALNVDRWCNSSLVHTDRNTGDVTGHYKTHKTFNRANWGS